MQKGGGGLMAKINISELLGEIQQNTLLRAEADWNDGEDILDWVKRTEETRTAGTYFSASFWNMSQNKSMRVGQYGIGSQYWTALVLSSGNVNNGWQRQVILFFPIYGNSKELIEAIITSNASRDLTLEVKTLVS